VGKRGKGEVAKRGKGEVGKRKKGEGLKGNMGHQDTRFSDYNIFHSQANLIARSVVRSG